MFHRESDPLKNLVSERDVVVIGVVVLVLQIQGDRISLIRLDHLSCHSSMWTRLSCIYTGSNIPVNALGKECTAD